MMISFFKHGQGGGETPVNYLIAEKILARDTKMRHIIRDANGKPTYKTRNPLPTVLAGKPETTIELINGTPHKWSFRSGVIAFANEDNPSEYQQRKVMQEFEKLAFAGIERDQYDILWVRHEHEGNVELHFVTPRIELTTGKSLNIAPPNFFRAFDALGDVLNKTYHWKDPRDSLNAREVIKPNEPAKRVERREALHKWITEQIMDSDVHDRSSMIQAFQSIGFEINRQGKDYLWDCCINFEILTGFVI